MATIPSGTKFLGVDPAFTDITERKGAKVDRKTEYFSLEDLQDSISLGGDYKVYRAILTQTGTSAPVATVLENTVGDIVWTRNGQGFYKGTLSNAFDENKTFYYINSKKYLEDVTFSMELGNIDEVLIYSFNNAGTIGYDSYLFKTPIEIIVYN